MFGFLIDNKILSNMQSPQIFFTIDLFSAVIYLTHLVRLTKLVDQSRSVRFKLTKF